MSSRFVRRIARAKELEERLMSEGRHEDAQIVHQIRRSGQVALSTLKNLYRDNMELRAELGKPPLLTEDNVGEVQAKEV